MLLAVPPNHFTWPQTNHGAHLDHAIPVTKEGVYALNRTDPDLYMEVIGSDPKEPIYGAIAEVFHQLHCLVRPLHHAWLYLPCPLTHANNSWQNLIRQHSWSLELFDKNWGDLYPSFLWDDPVLGRMHVDHCFEALRLQLMCKADITPMLNEHVDDPDFDRKADFNTHQKCRNFDKIAEYVETMGYDIPPPAFLDNAHHANERRRFITPTKPRRK